MWIALASITRHIFSLCAVLVVFAAPAIASDANYTCQAKWYHTPFNTESPSKPEIRKCSSRDKLEAAGGLTSWSGYITQQRKIYFVTRNIRRESICPGVGPGALGNIFVPRCWSAKRYNDFEERVYQFISDDTALLKPIPVNGQHGSHQPVLPQKTEKYNQFAVVGESVFYKGMPVSNADSNTFELVLDTPEVLHELTIAQDKKNTYVFPYLEPVQILPRLSIHALDWVSYQCATQNGCPNGTISGMFRVGNDGYWVGWHSSGITVFPGLAVADLKCYFEGTGSVADTNYCARDNKVVLISQRGMAEHPVLVSLEPLIDRQRYVCPSAKRLDPALTERLDSMIRKAYGLLRDRGSVKALPPEAERLLRIAAAYGNSWARKTIAESLDKSRDNKEATRFLKELVQIGVAGAGYDLAEKLTNSPLESEQNAAILAYKTAADLGDTDSMLRIAKILESVHYDPKLISQIRQCAASNGDGNAAHLIAKRLESEEQYPQALKAYQNAVKLGSADAALRLASIFGYGKGPDMDMEFKQPSDSDRAERYYAISRALMLGYSEEARKIDELVPLPPAKLKNWDGKLQEPNRVQRGDITEEMLIEMAKQKRLDPATGRPL